MEKKFIGNEQAYISTKEYLQLKNPGALLFEGPAGIGKSIAASSLAGELLQCSEKELSFNTDFMLVGEDCRQIKVADIDEVISKSTISGISSNGSKVFIILEAGNMTVQAQNMLLKLLEDNYQNNRVIMTCSEVSPLETILSRSYRVTFTSLDNSLIKNFLQDKVPPEDLDLACGLCHGCPYVWNQISDYFDSFKDTYKCILRMENKTSLYGILHLLKEKDNDNFYEVHASHWSEGISFFLYLFSGILDIKLGLPIEQNFGQSISAISKFYTLNGTYKILDTIIKYKKMKSFMKNDFFELIKIFVEVQ